MILPRRLAGPGTIGIVTPSGHLLDPERLELAIANLEARGWRVKRGDRLLEKWKYFNAPDADRAAQFHAIATDPEVDVVIPARGGYGISRLLDRMDWPALAATRKYFVGFSDFTAFSLALLAQQRGVTFAGPMARTDFGNDSVDPLMEENFWPLLTQASHAAPAIAWAHGYAPQEIEGMAWGTNLSLVAHLVGTPWFPDVRGGILFAEDIGEEPYHIERCFLQLKYAGVLATQRAIVLATFNGFDPDSDVARRHTLDDVIETLREIAPCPVLAGFPFGHAAPKISIPVGGHARLAIREGEYAVTFSGYNAP